MRTLWTQGDSAGSVVYKKSPGPEAGHHRDPDHMDRTMDRALDRTMDRALDRTMDRALDRALVLTWVLLSLCSAPLWARPSEYQLESEPLSPCERLRESSSSPGPVPQCTVDGQFSPVQCAGGQCWCVDAEGQELSGTRTSDSAPHCPTRCQLQSVLRCSSLGGFESVQCDSSRGQCWCVDQDGMELYGTRQKGRPETCPGSCEVRSRRVLHSSSPVSAPQCSGDGSFLPVQCKFINSTDRSELDLTSAFSSFPEAFETFSNFRSFFPMVSSYCFCSDRRGTEVQDTGLELLMSQVYDTAFSGLRSGRTFSESNIYRVLQRRLLGVRLALTGNFRCPSPCEALGAAASCDSDGAFSPTQCLQGGPCWCVDRDGREIPGTRQDRDSISCGPSPGPGPGCVSQRRSALSRLFFGPLSPPSSSSPSTASCSSLLRPLSDLLPVQTDPRTLLIRLVRVLDGLFPSVDSALRALSRSSPRRFQENLFGGKFLKMAAEGNLTGAVGTNGALGLDRIRSEDGLQRIKTNQDLVLTVVRVLEDPGFLSALKNSLRGQDRRQSITEALSALVLSCSDRAPSDRAPSDRAPSDLSSVFVPRCSSSGGFSPVQCRGEVCWCVDRDGLELDGTRTRGRPRCPSECERQRSAALRLQGALSAGAELHVPACSEAGRFLSLQCVGERCFCVDEEGRATADSAPNCPQRAAEQTRTSSGSCSEALAEVSAFKQEVMSLVALSNSSHFPLGLGFLLARGFRFTSEIGQSEPPLLQLLSDSNAALRLAAVSVYQQLVAPQRQSFQTFSPQCDSDGNWVPTQCDHSTGQCWCVDEDGHFISGSLTNRRAPNCPSRCDRARAQTLLSDWSGGPECGQDGPGVPAPQPGGAAAVCRLLDISHGALRCGPVADGYQRCDLVCNRGYRNALPVSNFLCETSSRSWTGTRPGPEACQIPQPLQTWTWAQTWSWFQSCPETGSVGSVLLNALSSRGLCSAQAPVSGRSLSFCDGSTVGLQCEEDSVRLDLTWTLDLSELSPQDLPDLHSPGDQYSSASKSEYSTSGSESLKADSGPGPFLDPSSYPEAVQGILGKMATSQLRLVSVTTPRFGCRSGFGWDSEREACLRCPPGTFSRDGACPLCPAGTYQDREGRDSCVTCPRGSSGIGASAVSQCLTECQRRGLRCSESGDFLPAQPDFLSGTWRCVTKEGAGLPWTNSETALTDKECTALSNFQLLSESEVLFGSEDSQILRTVAADRTSCLRECALDSSCHHVALLSGQCEIYSTASENTECTASTQTNGFLGNPEAEHFDWLRCSVKVRGGASGRQVFRKTGDRYSSASKSEYSTSSAVTLRRAESGVYRTQVFSANQSALSDVQRFCLSACRTDPCCEGFVLNENKISSGSVLCGFLRTPPVLMCSDQDWDVIGRGAASRECGAGLIYNERRGNFLFNFGGHKFTFSATDAALTKDEKGYQASLVISSTVHLSSEPKPDSVGSCPGPQSGPAVDPSVLEKYESLSEDEVELDPQKKPPTLTFWFNKKNYNSQQALLSCLARCDSEPLCSMADLSDLSDPQDGFFSCELFPDTRVCGAYDKPSRRQCRPLLQRVPNNSYTKRVDVSGPVKSFYQRVPFQKMVSYSVRSRISVPEDAPLSQGFRECERRCDEDHCCRGFGLVRDTKTGSKPGSGLVCLSLISLGVQTCPEDQTSWTSQDCGPSQLRTGPDPLGWYLKPVNQWSSSPGLCPDFSLPQTRTSVDRDQWSPVSGSAHLLVDPALSTYDIIHLSRDITKDQEKTLDWCLHACQESESCFAVSVSETDSGVRCLLYPDTSVCGLSSAPESPSPTSSCQLIIREPAPQVYVRSARQIQSESVSIPGHGSLQGRTVDLSLGSDRTRAVVQFLGVPYARPPIGSLRFGPAQPSDWTGARDATALRPGCVEPGQTVQTGTSEDQTGTSEDQTGTSEDCLYLNIFTPRVRRGQVPVLVYFYNAPTGLLDGSLLAALGNLVVVTAQYRTSVLGFGLGDAGLSDQEAVLRWVSAHIGLVGGAKDRVTAGAERQGADILSVALASPGAPLFQRLILMGGSVSSPVLTRSESESRRLTLDLARDLGCGDITDLDLVARCLRAVDLPRLNAAQTGLLARTGPLRAWGPVLRRDQNQTFHRVDLLLGTSDLDGLISRARTIKNFEELAGRAESKTVFYEALVQSLGQDQDLLKEAASWFYSLDHSPNPASYNLFSRALNNATRDLFVVCPSLKMAQLWAQSKANVYLYHQPATPTRADVRVPLDVHFLFGEPHRPISSQRFTSAERRLSLALITYISTFIHSGDPNPSSVWPESVLPRWGRVLPSETMPTYLELSPALNNLQGLRQRECSFWNQLAPRLRGESGAEPVPVAPPLTSVGQSQPEKDGYS